MPQTCWASALLLSYNSSLSGMFLNVVFSLLALVASPKLCWEANGGNKFMSIKVREDLES